MIVTYRKSAIRDVEKAAEYLRRQAGDTVANRFLESIESRIALLRLFPDAGHVVAHESRAMPLSDFPYQLYYRSTARPQLIILRIRHAHRRPLTWL